MFLAYYIVTSALVMARVTRGVSGATLTLTLENPDPQQGSGFTVVWVRVSWGFKGPRVAVGVTSSV